jgi:hypothetical protein
MTVLGQKVSWTTIATFVLTGIVLGFLAALGEDIYHFLKSIDYSVLGAWGTEIVLLLTRTVEVPFVTILIFLIVSIPLYRLLNKYILSRLIHEVIFIDKFTSKAIYWAMNYWGSTNPQKTNRIENNQMIFEAQAHEWAWKGNPGQNGALYDLRAGITKDLFYTVECMVISTPGTTMQFRLWLHDTEGNHSVITEPETPPTDKPKRYSLRFKATETRAMRIHLHCFAGQGRIIVSEVRVIRK